MPTRRRFCTSLEAVPDVLSDLNRVLLNVIGETNGLLPASKDALLKWTVELVANAGSKVGFRRPLARRALQGASRRPIPAIQATRRHGPLESAAPESLRDR